ncbi:OmpA family protein [Frigidibacter sp. ROC022]|uniref:OmpA family protein n=1 Tax=Frigidibacter sp. ROC022 TaxID=2971796 RepID=UPI00215B71B1|nr:OmpA family protein [Frigidibacter sp. ROC022]MCR8724852.1 OmpA family protein [Frigidibacter sp. ROC022]
MIRAALALLLSATPALAVTLELPGAANVTAATTETGGLRLPVGVFAEGQVPTREFAGQVSRQAWEVPGDLTSYQLLDPLRAQLIAQGFTLLVDCDTITCGGFDFRFAIDVMPEPAMHVDLGDFRYLAAEKPGEDGTEAISLLVSRSATAAFLQVQVVETGAAAQGADNGQAITITPGQGDGKGPVPDGIDYQPGNLAKLLEANGFVVLDDLTFGTGSTELGPGPYASLAELAAYLNAHADRKVILVGHTDSTGGLDINIAVSRRRAASVVERLATSYGVPRNQISAEAVGYLAPRASNLTEAGRTANRRVEAVLISTE